MLKNILLLVLLLSGCKIDRERKIDRDRFTFQMTADSHLFFKNVRQLYYDFTDLQEAKLHVYRYSDRQKGNAYPCMHPTLVVDWLRNEAYVLIEVNEILQDQDELVIYEKSSPTGVKYSYSLVERGRLNMLEFATKIYEGIMTESEFSVRINGQVVPIFTDETDRENFRVAMADYYRLTRIIR